jgi:hypothetical protein
MPITIGSLTSHVTVTEGGPAALTDEMVERVVQAAVARMKDEMRAEEQARQEREVPDRRSDANPY